MDFFGQEERSKLVSQGGNSKRLQLPEAPSGREEATVQHPQLTRLFLAGQAYEENMRRAQVTALRIYFQLSSYVLEPTFAPDKSHVKFFFFFK